MKTVKLEREEQECVSNFEQAQGERITFTEKELKKIKRSSGVVSWLDGMKMVKAGLWSVDHMVERTIP